MHTRHKPDGPYYQWTAKVNGKTVARRLAEAAHYREWIANDRRPRALITPMRQTAVKLPRTKAVVSLWRLRPPS